MSAVPTISLRDGISDAATMARLDAACRDHGFFLLTDHGMDAAIEAMWSASMEFFTAPMDYKRQVMRTDEIPLGYYERELTKRQRDQKEVFDYMKPRPDKTDVNQWPEDPTFKDALISFFDAAALAAQQTLALVYSALGANPKVLPRGDARTSTVRLNYYPQEDPLAEVERVGIAELGDMALHHHTDPGVLTLLLQDAAGGLQTHSHEDGWIEVPPQPGTIVINLGDSLQVWSNDVYRAAIHRVVPVGHGGRYSTPFFFNPTRDAVLEPLPELDDAEPKYRTFTWREFIRARVDDNFADLGEDDTQISQYRVN
jgi:isopenicillin N synthase-like dioxygenase